ncbi:DUF3106 domain-containing protein [Ramlibacter humi]|uniref:DUF3106 domain-containing protein n=1 Tax=Ramlibacter humi TaxID=2530451 RepID=A0A4Z0C9V2_9BURK|nr:DUF3106 domain-containing protein [Ramlibacter humi]TFZ08447.1 DUF3106 domain-containing protein [Ramlibacter humi]
MRAARLRPALAAGLAAALLAGLCAAQVPNPPAAGASAAKPASTKPAASRAASAQRAAAEPRPTWAELTPDQQQALRPLAGDWSRLSEGQKRKWIAMSRNYRQMKPEEQAKLHSRMNEWVALSPQQRTQARLNFAETKNLSADDKKAKWEAYQALSPEEKKKLAAGAGGKTASTAAAVKPVPPQKLANTPRPDPSGKSSPRIAAGPEGASAVPLPAPAHQ